VASALYHHLITNQHQEPAFELTISCHLLYCVLHSTAYGFLHGHVYIKPTNLYYQKNIV
jgi:hypothetical protein